jgi:ATP-dependent DNA helicase DinG
VPGQRQRIADKDLAFRPLNDATEELLAATAAAATASGALNQGTETLEDLASGTMDLLLKAAAAGQLLRQLERDVRFVTADPSDRWVTWLEPARRGGIQALGATPLEAGPLLRDLWLEGQRAPVATSATLAVDGDFGFMLGELGLTGRRPPTATLSVPSPFAWAEQALCLAAEDLPDPDQAEFAGTIAAVLADLRRTVPRQTLALFTSYRLLQAVADQLMALEVQDDLFAGSRGEILVQSPRTSPADLRHRFRNARAAMLLGTSTFWEGVDFPGDSLEILVVTKLPFLVPSDPWVEARCEHLKAAGENPFTAFMVRDAVLRLRQGIGRLIRRRSDRGVVLLLDNRLISRHYGATFLSCLPVPVRWLPETGQLAAATAEFLDRS